jgi:hypothetical protein
MLLRLDSDSDLMGAFFGVTPERYELASNRQRRALQKDVGPILERFENPDQPFSATLSRWEELWPDFAKSYSEHGFPAIDAGIENLLEARSGLSKKARAAASFLSGDGAENQVEVFLRFLALAGRVWRVAECVPASLLKLPTSDRELAKTDREDVDELVSLAYKAASVLDTRPRGSHVPAQLFISELLLEKMKFQSGVPEVPGVSVFAAFHYGIGLSDILARRAWLDTKVRTKGSPR